MSQWEKTKQLKGKYAKDTNTNKYRESIKMQKDIHPH